MQKIFFIEVMLSLCTLPTFWLDLKMRIKHGKLRISYELVPRRWIRCNATLVQPIVKKRLIGETLDVFCTGLSWEMKRMIKETITFVEARWFSVFCNYKTQLKSDFIQTKDDRLCEKRVSEVKKYHAQYARLFAFCLIKSPCKKI